MTAVVYIHSKPRACYKFTSTGKTFFPFTRRIYDVRFKTIYDDVNHGVILNQCNISRRVTRAYPMTADGCGPRVKFQILNGTFSQLPPPLASIENVLVGWRVLNTTRGERHCQIAIITSSPRIRKIITISKSRMLMLSLYNNNNVYRLRLVHGYIRRVGGISNTIGI